MKCADFERNILLLASDNPVDASVRGTSLAHARLCGRCANRLSEEQNLIGGIRAVRADLAVETTPPRVEQRLLSAVRTQATSAAPMNVLQQPNLHVWQVGAVAAVILVLVSTVAFFWQRPASPAKRANITSAVTPGSSAPRQQSLSVAPDRERRPVASAKRSRTRRSGRHITPDDDEVVTEFYPLIEGDDLTALEGIRLVTVELPGSALGEVGLPRPPAAETTSVRAEVLLSQDGVARAIRFVQ